jgi:hypothetical protein
MSRGDSGQKPITYGQRDSPSRGGPHRGGPAPARPAAATPGGGGEVLSKDTKQSEGSIRDTSAMEVDGVV